MRTSKDYLQMLRGLLPRGEIWRVEQGSNLEKMLLSYADELARLDGEVYRFIKEVNPQTSIEALEDWERVLGLPDECLGSEQTIELRRKMVIRKLQRGKSFSKAYLLELAKDMGYEEASIEEYKVFQVGSCAGDRLYSASSESVSDFAWRYTLLLNLGKTQIRHFRAGQSQVGDRLRTWGDKIVECMINRDKPAHINVLFGYNE